MSLRALCIALAAALTCATANAHTLSASEVLIDGNGSTGALQVQWEIALADVQALVDLDDNADGVVTARELDTARSAVAQRTLPALTISRGGIACELRMRDLLLDERTDGYYAVLMIAGNCVSNGPLGVDYQLLFDVDRSHRAVVRVHDGAQTLATVLAPDSRHWQAAASPSLWRDFGAFVRHGIHHIWVGYDHLAFLLLLLLPVALRARRRGWESSSGVREVALRTLRIVTAFTLAHSITLSLAATGVVVLPERPVEVAIAASVAVAGLVNLYPRLAQHAAWIAFFFGFVHGFGFANVLREIGLESGSLAVSLAGFNVGVEIGQLAVTALLLPAIYRQRTTEFYRRRFVPAVSLATTLVALGWMLERATG